MDVKRIALPDTAKSSCDGCVFNHGNDDMRCWKPDEPNGLEDCDEVIDDEFIDYIFVDS